MIQYSIQSKTIFTSLTVYQIVMIVHSAKVKGSKAKVEAPKSENLQRLRFTGDNEFDVDEEKKIAINKISTNENH